jgi:hypothetical protein
MSSSHNRNIDLDSPPDSVLASLEPDQLTAAKQRFGKRSLKGPEIVLLWALRIYLLFMIAVVVYQIFSSK